MPLSFARTGKSQRVTRGNAVRGYGAPSFSSDVTNEVTLLTVLFFARFPKCVYSLNYFRTVLAFLPMPFLDSRSQHKVIRKNNLLNTHSVNI